MELRGSHLAKESPAGTAVTPLRGLTVIVPAYNEAASLGETLESLLGQTCVPDEIIVVDDCSTDGTGVVAERYGVTVLRPPHNTGSKAGAQNFALTQVHTPFVMALDADTTLAPDAIEKLAAAFDRDRVAAACGFVLPRRVRTMWERGRYVEYLFAFTFYKQVQDYYQKPLISSGCFSMYRTAILRDMGGWPSRTLAEDMDLTWSLYESGYEVRFLPEAVSYPLEPHNASFMSKQLRRWSHGFVQNLRLHWRGLTAVRFLGSAVAVTMWDALIASMAYLVIVPALVLILGTPWPLLVYLIDAPAILVPVLAGALPRGEGVRALASFPSFFVLRAVNSVFFLEAVWTELVRRRPLLVYEKGH